MSRMTPDIAKKPLDAPTKSKRMGLPSRLAPSADGRASSFEVPRVPTIACVNRTAVKSETSVPTPRVNAKPLTPEVASTKRMNATRIVTTFASMIALMPLR